MRYLIASDIHGSEFWCAKLMQAFEEYRCEQMVFLGDILYHGPRNDLPENYAPKQVIAELNPRKEQIAICMNGNCDAEVDQMVLDFPLVKGCKKICLNGRGIYLTHGHRTNAEEDGIHLPAGFQEGDVLLHGHTHVPKAERMTAGGITLYLLNPGSVSIPKGGFPNSFAVLDDDCTFTVYDFEGNTIKSIRIL